MMTKLIVKRNWEWRLRKITIYLDGANIDEIARGKNKELWVDEGPHALQAKINWCTSPAVHFTTQGEPERVFSISGFPWANGLTVAAVLIVALQLILVRTSSVHFFIWLLVPLLLPHLYYLTIGRKKFLRLKEEPKHTTTPQGLCKNDKH